MTSRLERWWNAARAHSRSLFRRRAAEGELDEELRFHFDTAVERYVSSGMTPEAARRRARVEYGGIEQIKEECRQSWGSMAVENVGRDLVQAMRGIRRAPGFAAVAALTLGIGIGANIALFSLLYSLVFRPLPVRDAGSVRNVHVAAIGKGDRSYWGVHYLVSFPEFNYMRAHSRTAELAGVAESFVSFRGASGGSLLVQLVSANLLPMVAVRPALGRFFAESEVTTPGSAPVAVLSFAAWQKYFGSSPAIIGRSIRLNRTLFTVVGVASPDTKGPLITVPDIWMPLTMDAVAHTVNPAIFDANIGWIQVIGRIRPSVSDAQMAAELRVLAQQALAAHGSMKTAVVTVERAAFFNTPNIFTEGAPLIAILSLAVGMVLLVAASNVANMLLARGLSRQREIAIRLSIGAGTGRIAQQFLIESLVLALLGGAAGLILSQLAVRAVLRTMAIFGAIQVDVSPDASVLLFTFSLAILTGFVFGLIPALRLVRGDVGSALKNGGAAGLSSSRSNQRTQNVLVGVQVAVTVVLVANAGLLLRGFGQALDRDTGQKLHKILVASMDLPQQRYTADLARRFIQRYRDAAAALPGVNSVSFSTMNPLISGCDGEARLVGPDGKPGEVAVIGCASVGPGFFHTFGMRLFAGREFSAADMASGGKAVIVEQRYVDRFIGRGNPLGRHILFGDDDCEIVGVAAHVANIQPGSDLPMVYRAAHGEEFLNSHLIVGYDGDAATLQRLLVEAAARIDPAVTATVKRIEDNVAQALVPARLAAAAASTLGGLGLVLACSGIYGVVAFMVARRLRDVGIRMALGGSRRDILKLMLGQGLRPVMAGAALGLPLAFAGAQLIQTMLYGVSTVDPAAFLSATALLLATTVVAVLLPVRRALAVDPAAVLRNE